MIPLWVKCFPVNSRHICPVFQLFFKACVYRPLERSLHCILLILIKIYNLQNSCLASKRAEMTYRPVIIGLYGYKNSLHTYLQAIILILICNFHLNKPGLYRIHHSVDYGVVLHQKVHYSHRESYIYRGVTHESRRISFYSC